jgi:hypothetical protein
MNFDVLHAVADDGQSIPVIDVTNPAFAVSATDDELDGMSRQYIQEQQQRGEISPAVRAALSNSILGRALLSAAGSYLPGMGTYFLKLGPGYAGFSAHVIDRQIAASLPALAARLRLQDIAGLLAEGLAAQLANQPERPVCLINIAGGPAADSWNALILLQKRDRSLLAGRKIAIAVLDLDTRGPDFGARALAALQAPNAPLEGLEISFRAIRYDWSGAVELPYALSSLQAADTVCSISSEGGLFEYGADEEIAANLEKLHQGTGRDAFIVGSFCRDCDAVNLAPNRSLMATRPRALETYRALVERTGWTFDHVLERPFSYNMRLKKL